MATHRARLRELGSAEWTEVDLELTTSALVVHPPEGATWAWMLSEVASVEELAPFDAEPRHLELCIDGASTVLLDLPGELVEPLCVALRAAVPAAGSTPVDQRSANDAAWWRVGVATALLALLVIVVSLGSDVGQPRLHRPAAVAAGAPQDGTPSTVSTTSSSSSSTPSTSSTSSSTSSPPSTPTAAASPPTSTAPAVVAPPPEPTVIAPLTGLPVPASAVARNAIVSKIDASAPAMPQVGLEQADMVLEVKIEWGLSRYLAVFHSRQPAVIGPHRSARTTDPDLLAMFGHPLFAFSGANPGVVDRLALTTWKTGVGPGEVAQAWFRDESRPFPHNLFAASEVLRSRPAPPLFPVPRFFHRAPGTAGGGVPVDGMAVSAGATALFRWDPALGAWRRWVHDREHVVAGGAPVAPTNVVVVETFYGISAADANSPEAVSVGWGRAWVFADGAVVAGSWTRLDRNAPYDLRDGAGAPITLLPGQTWVVLADREPFIDPRG